MATTRNNQTNSRRSTVKAVPLPTSPGKTELTRSSRTNKQSKIRDAAPGIEAGQALSSFHPVIQTWFRRRFKTPTDAQAAGWPAIQSGRDVLIAAPTGSGKTLAAFLAGIDSLLRQPDLPRTTAIVYVSPLKALGNDIQRNLEAPLAELREVAEEMGVTLPSIDVWVRTGDTPQAERQAMVRTPPHILITTPESFYLMLTAARSRERMRHVQTVIVDEIHALARDKRGSHFSLSMTRLDHICEARPQRIGLSATQRPIEDLAAFLVGVEAPSSNVAESLPVRPCEIIDLGHQRDLELHVDVPPSDLEAVAPKEQWDDIYTRLAELVLAHRTTLIFVNTRRLSERVAHNLAQRLAEDVVMSHHGSLSRDRRLRVEERLKSGHLKALVATASLELGIDIGSIDLVCQIGSPRSIATFLQRVGRSGHALGLRPHGRLFPTTRDELVECAALVRAARAGHLDRIVQPIGPLDVLAQQIVAETACEDWKEDDLFVLFRGATPYRDLPREDFDDIIDMLGNGVGDGAGRSPPLIHRDRINGVIRARRGSRMTSILNGGTIPELGDFRVIADPDETVVGTVNEDWAIESMAGDIFLLGSTSWKIRRIESAASVVRVEDARGAPPTIPFWLGEAPGRTIELSEEVGRLRSDVEAGLGSPDALREKLKAECGLDDLGAIQIIDYVRATRDALGLVPTHRDVVFERFFDESGGMQLVVHAPFGARINKAWGLTLRKRFCVNFDFELQAAASDDAIVLSLGHQHSFPLEEAFSFVGSRNAEEALRQSVLYVPIFPTRWRWNATRALAIQRQTVRRKVPPQIQRMRADDLLAAVFPDQVGCQENITGPLQVPDHPLIKQTMLDCIHEAMDLDGLLDLLGRIEAGEITLHARDTVEPSPMAHEILGGKPFTYLDDAPLEERRTRAVSLRRSLPESARDLGALDPAAIDRVREEAWPDPRDAEELHDVLLSLVVLSDAAVPDWRPWLEELLSAGRASTLRIPRPGASEPPPARPDALEGRVEEPAAGRHIWFAAENLNLVRFLFPDATIQPALDLQEGVAIPVADREEARLRLIRGQMEVRGPVTSASLAGEVGLTERDVDYGMRQAEASGYVLRGRFSQGAEADEFCDRRLLARIHRYTLDSLRREVDPVSPQDFMRFLLRWHHLTPDTRLEGKMGVRQAILRLQGFEAAAVGWERELLSARIRDYRIAWLDELCLAGEVVWARLTPRKVSATSKGPAPSRVTPVTVALRPDFPVLLAGVRAGNGIASPPTTGAAGEVFELLEGRGALFFDEIVNRTRRLKSDVERGLRELVAWGLVTADGFQGLRQLAGGIGQSRRPRMRAALYGPGGVFTGPGPAGRWSVVHLRVEPLRQDELAEGVAQVLLQRYGVVFRDLIQRESFTVPWRDVLRALRRLEARGVIPGGRFVSGFVGEQYALPEAVESLRRVRRTERTGERVWVSAIDPLNLVGIILPGARLPAQPGKGFLLVDGIPAGPAAPLENETPSARGRVPAAVAS
jgi:ATP-dependent helicase Lhr and Lhr-like helicase